ncbi:MAG: rhodanese-like domain-containing protein [Saprospiraceae bacterium]|nr:rhodanese-like domain-containing protein [Saprospiraceae bacterium]
MEDITVQELRKRQNQGDAVKLIDVREPYEHEEFNLGGKNLPLGEIQSWMSELESEKESEMVLYCRTGNRSGMAAAFLKANGFAHARNLTGGVVAWQEMVDREDA